LPPALAVAALLLAMAGCGFGPGQRIKQPVLTGPAIQEVLAGNTLHGRTAAGAAIDLYYRPDGTVFAAGRERSGVAFADRGRWSVEDDRICTRFQAIRGRVKLCEWVTQSGEDLRTYEPLGRPSASGVIEPGDSRGLDAGAG